MKERQQLELQKKKIINNYNVEKNGFKLDDILNKFNDFDLSEDEIKEVYENN